MPKVRKREICLLKPIQCETLFAECQKHRLGEMMIVTSMTGLRKGDLLALEWSTVDLSECVQSVRQTIDIDEVAGTFGTEAPTGDTGRRLITRGAIAANALKSRYAKSMDEGLEPSEVPLVFPNTVGKLHRMANFDRRVWHPIRETGGLPRSFHFHDLRHTQASLMIAAGVPMKVVQERLGHSDYTLTANTYSHLLQGAQADAAENVDRLLNFTPK